MTDSSAKLVQRRRPKSVAPDAASSKAIHRALDVLECFPDEHTVMSLREIAGRHGWPEASLFRILQTLQSRGYLTQADDGTYRLATRVLYGKQREQSDRLRELARPHLQALAMRFDETASLSFLFEDRIQVLDTVESFHAMRWTNRPGRILPPHCSAMGKCITSFQPPERIKRMLEVYGLFKRGPKTITDTATLFAEYEQIRARGYGFDREESAEGGFCVGAPVRIPDRPVTAAVSLSTPLIRFNPDSEPAIIEHVCATAKAIAHTIAE